MMIRDAHHLTAMAGTADSHGPGRWLACEHPNRQANGYVVYVWTCAECMAALIGHVNEDVASVAGPTVYHGGLTVDDLAGQLAQARAWRARRGLTRI